MKDQKMGNNTVKEINYILMLCCMIIFFVFYQRFVDIIKKKTIESPL